MTTTPPHGQRGDPALSDRFVRVGVGVVVARGRQVLLGLRSGAHGAGTWAFPGGHLEFGESPEACAVREVLEETGLRVTPVRRVGYTSDVFATEGRHYLTVYVEARSTEGSPVVREPGKCRQWAWFDWSSLPTPLFAPVASWLASGGMAGDAD